MNKTMVNALALNLVSKGFVGREAKKWVNNSWEHYLHHSNYSFGETRWAIKHGFMPEQMDALGLNRENYTSTISAKDYAYLRPINGTYSKWIADKITVNNVFRKYSGYLKTCHYHFLNRDGQTLIIPLSEQVKGDTFDDVLAFIREAGPFLLSTTVGSYSKKIEYVDGKYVLGHRTYTEKEFLRILKTVKKSVVLEEFVVPQKDFTGVRVNLVVYNEHGDNPVIGAATISVQEFDKLIGLQVDEENQVFISEEEADYPSLEGESEGKEAQGTSYDDRYVSNESIQEKEFAENAEGTNAYDDDNSDEDSADSGSGEKIINQIYAPVDVNTGRIGTAFHQLDGRNVEININPNTDEALPEVIPFWDEIKATVDKMCRFTPQLEFFGVSIIITEDGFRFIKFKNHPEYPVVEAFDGKLSDYLKRKVAQKQEAYKSLWTRIMRGGKKVKLKIRAKYAKTFFPKGLIPYLSIKLFQDFRKDFITNKDTTFKEKRWAYRHGFLSYRLKQYGITEENHLNYISDFEYRWLRHINNKYRHWMEDKITVKYICSKYNECFPGYYFHISLKDGNNKVVPMMDCPEEYTNSFEDIFKLVKEKGQLALKPDEGSHGDGFYKFSYADGKYYLNHEEATKDDVMKILTDVNNQYLVTEYIDMHHEIKAIYDGAVNTIRMIVFKKDGKNPVIGNAYMRFGSKRTGAVDNMGAGGMFARIDIETGKFYDAKIIEANEIKPCLYHPDTGVKIEGYLPNWEKVKGLVLDVARDIPQLEYFGFDLALTEDGIKFPEINRFPDYPAIEKYTPQTMDYLLYKLEQKKKKYGYDVERGNTLIKLPKR